MGRLIDVDALIEEMKKEQESGKYDENTIVVSDCFIRILNGQPTAYNVENVVAELEEHRANFDCRICKYNKTEGQVCLKDCTDALIDGLFDIVKRGGIDERT